MMTLGSGDTRALLSGIDTRAHRALLSKFVALESPYYNAKASPIDALRTGAILEERYSLLLDDDWFFQYSIRCEEMDVFSAHLDYAQIAEGKIVDFVELKSINDYDFTELMPYKDNDALVGYVKKYYKPYYEQVQQQLLCTGLESCSLVFIDVLSYDDAENYQRFIKESELVSVRIFRDEAVINRIKERGKIFQQIKDYFNGNLPCTDKPL